MSTNVRPRVFSRPVEEGLPETQIVEDFKDELPILSISETPKAAEAEVYSTVALRLPTMVLEEYQRAAAAQELTVEDLMQYRLIACRTHNALRGLWFSDSERSQLENLIQKWPLESASQALSIISRAGSVKFDDVEVILTPAQKRVISLSMFGGRTPQSFFEAMVKKELRT